VVEISFIGSSPETIIIPQMEVTSPSVELVNRLFEVIAGSGNNLDNINLHPLIMLGSGFYQYNGSLTTPPCTEGVKWFIQATPVPVQQSQVEYFRTYIGGFPGNARDTQPLNARRIAYYVD
jgi:carbonic anhydrase